MVAEQHWADRHATAALESGRYPIISTGISPSGEIHVGNMREVLTADAVFRVLGERDVACRFNYVADNYDPLRRVYPFLDREKYEPLIGRPLSEIPCPCDAHASYAEHFLVPFLGALERLGVEVEVERADLMYKSGRMTPWVLLALERRDTIVSILEELTGKRFEDGWSPFNPLCGDCGRMTETGVTGFCRATETVDYDCSCGSAGCVPIAGGGKLTWRIDWPARWCMLGVSIEPFGKDHATRGGSYDTGVRIVREVFEADPPYPIPYEWIRLRGRGDMASSKGNVLSISQMLEVVPPEVLRYLVIRERPSKTINFDPGVPLLQLADEVDDPDSGKADSRSLFLSRAGKFEPTGVSFKHLVVVAQAAEFDAERTMAILARAGFPDANRNAVAERLAYARRWLSEFAPEQMRFTVCREMPSVVAGLNAEQRQFLAALAEGLNAGMDGQAVHDAIYDIAGRFEGVRPATLFEAIYMALLGKTRGPRAGWFLSVVGIEFCAERFRDAAQANA